MPVTPVKHSGDESGRGGYRAPAAEKVLDILEFMAAQPDGLTQTEISTGLGRSIHEIYRILLLLEKRGYLIRTTADRLILSLRVFELAHKHPPVNRLVESALPVMRELALKTDQGCHLAVLKDLQVLVVLQIDSPLPMHYSVALGSQFPALETSSGAVLLAGLPRQDRDRTVERIITVGQAIGARDEIEARLEAAASCGHEMRPSLAVQACTNISLPVRNYTGAVVAALTVPFLPQKAARFDAETVFGHVVTAAAKISGALGATNPPVTPPGNAALSKLTRNNQGR
jgi:DNA-binding IclR family transcriptional regulator